MSPKSVAVIRSLSAARKVRDADDESYRMVNTYSEDGHTIIPLAAI